ncbi:MAG: rhodanese-like domain-containing protein [Anaerolineae bacterium]|jgi:rhodanese-related sulfurtransferase|nr:rhodanese-like domain-containing protein [Anaerolineae bacterium]MBT7324089.1 rhodanese-like domain-containing protein [Anaerolineae bacterium]
MDILGISFLAGVLVLAYILVNKLRGTSAVSLFQFMRRLRSGAKFRDINVSELEKMLRNREKNSLLIDLREVDVFEKDHIADAISLPFDDFMHEILVNETYGKDEAIILICDHGLKSKVAADILVVWQTRIDGYRKIWHPCVKRMCSNASKKI